MTIEKPSLKRIAVIFILGTAVLFPFSAYIVHYQLKPEVRALAHSYQETMADMSAKHRTTVMKLYEQIRKERAPFAVSDFDNVRTTEAGYVEVTISSGERIGDKPRTRIIRLTKKQASELGLALVKESHDRWSGATDVKTAQ